MSGTTVRVTLEKNRTTATIEGTRVGFSPHRCFQFDDGFEDVECLRALGSHLIDLPGLTFIGSKRSVEYFLKHVPEIGSRLLGSVCYQSEVGRSDGHGLASVAFDIGSLPEATQTVFLCETLTVPRMQIKQRLPGTVKIVEPTILAEIAPDLIPACGWVPLPLNIYPIEVPEISLRAGLDFAIVDCPSRNLALMPNGLAYLNNALKKTSVSFQILDLDIISYHRFHAHRLYDVGGEITLPGDLVLPEDPWKAEYYDLWTRSGGGASGSTGRNEVLEFFRPLIDETVAAVTRARPKVLGLSIQGCNEAAAQDIAAGVRAALPDIVIVVGGFSCYNADIGRRAFPECDYMCIGEADLTVGPLLEALARGERPFNQPGVLSRFDTPEYKYLPAPMIHDLDTIEFPRYEWMDLSVYRNYNGYQLTPIIASRGCRWSRCTFCAERFFWRIRTAENFVDELEWLINRGCHLFMFNESDLGGMPERVVEICEEIIRRGLHRKAKLTGQLRVNKKQTRAFFEKLREANFVALRFGIDAFSENTLRLQKKGYTVEMICQNLKDCWEVGIFTEVNWVIGVPGETERDVDEGIDLILRNRKYIGRLANINPLILVNGGVYWIDPEAHNIVFREPKEQLYATYPRALPADKWYSTDPYIDAQVRKERFEKIVIALHDAGFGVGAWANRIIEDVKYSRDKMRTGASAELNAGSGEFEIRAEAQPAADATASGDAGSLEVAGKLAPLEDRPRSGKIVPIRADGLVGRQPSKPAAEPPLFGVAGTAPRLVRQTDTHKVIFRDGWYYGIAHAVVGEDLSGLDLDRLPGVIRFASEGEVVAALEEAARWANLRGQYDDQRKQRTAGSYMRVDSVGDAPARGEVPVKPRILRTEGGYVAVSRQALTDALEGRRGRSGLRSTGGTAGPGNTPSIAGSTFLRRLANKLPHSTVDRIRSLVRQQARSDGTAFRAKTIRSDGQLAVMFLRAVGDTYLRRPFSWLKAKRGDVGSSNGPAQGLWVEEGDFYIVSVVTEGVQPELISTIGTFNLVAFDGSYYGVPHGFAIDWEAGNIMAVPGMLRGATMADVIAAIEKLTGGALPQRHVGAPSAAAAVIGPSKDPMLLGTMEAERYNLVAYEGWVYGLPQDLGDMDLAKVDVMEMPGVIRDVSRDAVESEVVSRSKDRRQAA
jgi:radical SAM superfamily enzyme YgiQ (UPF0313 family)